MAGTGQIDGGAGLRQRASERPYQKRSTPNDYHFMAKTAYP